MYFQPCSLFKNMSGAVCPTPTPGKRPKIAFRSTTQPLLGKLRLDIRPDSVIADVKKALNVVGIILNEIGGEVEDADMVRSEM